jgi:hypothetical protein
MEISSEQFLRKQATTIRPGIMLMDIDPMH